MARLKDLWNKLFVDVNNEDEEEIISGELEDLVMEEPDESLKEAKREKKRLEKEQKRQAELQRQEELKKQAEQRKAQQVKKQAQQEIEIEQEVQEEVVEVQPTQPVETKDSFVNIEIEKVEQPKKEKRPSRSVASTPRRKDDGNDYVYAPVISPYYGQSETETKQAKQVQKSSSTSSYPKKKKESDPFGTVVSPFYGKSEVVEVKSQKEVKPAPKKVQPVIVETEPEVNYVLNDELEERSMTLEEIIGKEEKGDIEQISLFGEVELLDDAKTQGDE